MRACPTSRASSPLASRGSRAQSAGLSVLRLWLEAKRSAGRREARAERCVCGGALSVLHPAVLVLTCCGSIQ